MESPAFAVFNRKYPDWALGDHSNQQEAAKRFAETGDTTAAVEGIARGRLWRSISDGPRYRFADPAGTGLTTDL